MIILLLSSGYGIYVVYFQTIYLYTYIYLAMYDNIVIIIIDYDSLFTREIVWSSISNAYIVYYVEYVAVH